MVCHHNLNALAEMIFILNRRELDYKNKELMKDAVLGYLMIQAAPTQEIVDWTKADKDLIDYIILQLAVDELVTSDSSKLIRITNKGYYFKKIDGGFYEKYRVQREEKNKRARDKWATIINAIFLLGIGIASVYFTYDSKEKDEEIKQLKKQIEILSPKSINHQ